MYCIRPRTLQSANTLISDPKDPYVGQYDEERVITLGDWYHDQMPGLMDGFISVGNPTGAEPVPDAALMNDTQNFTLAVKPSKTYLLRLVNVGAFAGQYFWIEGHTMKIVEVDGVYTEPAEADMIYLTTAQRYSVLVTMKNDTNANFAMVGSMDTVRLILPKFGMHRLTSSGSFRCLFRDTELQCDWLARIR